jgi:Ca-activated chloride channel family protein
VFTFEAPSFLLLTFLIPPGIYLKHFYPSRGNLISFPFAIWKNVGFVPRMHGFRLLLLLSHGAFWTGCFSIIIALAGPSLSLREKVFLNRGVDMIIVLDESPSMAARDFQPVNRFETAREVIRRFVQNRENDPIGLVSFSYEAVLRVPPTLDYAHLIKRLDELSIMDLGDGTAIGMGLSVACLHLRSSTAKEKVIILLTDGKNNTGEISPETAADIAAQMGIRVYAVGIGSSEETHIEFSDPKTGKYYRGTLEEGFDEALLRKIAQNSKGSYFYAGNPGTLSSIFQAIDSLETMERRVRIEVRSNPIHGRFILIGLLLIFSDFLFRVKILREVM